MNQVSPQSTFTQKVIQVIKSIPFSKVVSYGQVAAYVGFPRAARQVGWTLRSIKDSNSLPWWRVINSKGRISIEGNLYNDKHLQKKLLESEGIVISSDFKIDIEKYRFIADNEMLESWRLPKNYIEKLINKYNL